MSQTWCMLKRLIHQRRQCLFYAYDANQGAGTPDEHVEVYESWAAIPVDWRKTIVPSRWLDPMYFRLCRGAAKLLCYSGDGRALDAYGWVQDWKPFRRMFHELASEGTMLGPFRTSPPARGRGIYGRLLGHSLSLCPTERPILIYTAPENIASQRGIEKAGFRPLGAWELRQWLGGGFVRLRRMPSAKTSPAGT